MSDMGGHSRHFERATLASGLPPERTSTDRPVWSGSCQEQTLPPISLVPGFSQRSLHIKSQPLLGSHLFGPRLIDIGSDELVQRPDDLVVLVGTTLGSFAG
jgi:hypothetical protein